MRVSTLQIYNQSLASMQSQQARVQSTELQISSGLRIMKPSDDPSGAVKVINLSANINAIEQYSRNVSAAEASLGFEESVISSVNTNLQRIRELVIQGNNSTNPDYAKASIALEINERLDELVSLANTRNAAGEYIFAGFKVDSPPFTESNGVIAYQGDAGERQVQISEASKITVRDSGKAVFQDILSGNGSIEVLASASNTGNAVIGQFGSTGGFIPDNYTVTFSQLNPSDPVTYAVTDGTGGTIATGTYQEGSINFAGAQFVLSGTPADNDTITLNPSKNRDLFTTINDIAEALSRPAPEDKDRARFHNDMAEGLVNLDQALDNMNRIRAGIGARLNHVETLDSINQDLKLQLETVLSDTQDLDYAEAISRFNLQLNSLQAAQQAFVKATSLSLFQYI
ncbi:MAG: flagellar hook-associated protein 3 [SAR86 cluster bacterium]|uniref:Flagellar hook-associated protein 3 n=1 Tax=SAR86 cluster bacterium TaxID=2030880 RepID=A0A2A5CBE0_9GAMM|nr:MAG: flagellar hook-associated protein 3 [SAR86 cluster bacterium]